MPRTIALMLLGLLVAACGTEVPGIADAPQSGQEDREREPAGQQDREREPAADRDGPCRAPLADDAPDPFGGESHEVFGGPDEEDDLWVEPIQQLLAGELSVRSGGLWLDNREGEVVAMLTAPDPDGEDVAAADDAELLERLRDVSERPEAVVCMQAVYTEDELRSLVEEATRRLDGPMSGGVDTVRNLVTLEIETDPDQAREALGELADHPALVLSVPDCAEVAAPPADAVDLPGDGSNCRSMAALGGGTLGGDPEAGCVWFESEAEQRMPVAFPQGWTITPDGTIHDQRAEPVARLGDTVEAGGGYTEVELPAPCRVGDDEGAFLVGGMTVTDQR